MNIDAFLYLVLFIVLVLPRTYSLHQTQHESMGGPLRRGAEEKEDELSQRDQIDSEKELTAVKR